MILENGLEIYLIHQPYDLARVELVIKSGMLVEKPEEHGYAHLLEHLASFYPSPKYPSSLENQEEFTIREIDCNAWTSAYATGYFLEGVLEYLPLMLDYMYNHYNEPLWDEDMIPQEKKAVTQELTGYLNSTWNNLRTLINVCDFPDTVLSMGIEHEIATVENADIKDVIAFRDKYYSPCNCTLFITTDLDKCNFRSLGLVEKWGKIRNNKYSNTIKPFKYIRPPLRNKIFFAPSPSSKDYRIIISWDIPWKWNDIRIYTLEYLTMVLTDGLGSKLMKILRSDKGAIYSIHSKVETNFIGKSKFAITVNASEEDVRMVIDEIIKASNNLVITDEEWQRKVTRDKIKDEHFKDDGKFREYTEDIEVQLLWKVPIKTTKEIHEEVIQLDCDQINEIFKELFSQGPTVYYSGKKQVI